MPLAKHLSLSKPQFLHSENECIPQRNTAHVKECTSSPQHVLKKKSSVHTSCLLLNTELVFCCGEELLRHEPALRELSDLFNRTQLETNPPSFQAFWLQPVSLPTSSPNLASLCPQSTDREWLAQHAKPGVRCPDPCLPTDAP